MQRKSLKKIQGALNTLQINHTANPSLSFLLASTDRSAIRITHVSR